MRVRDALSAKQFRELTTGGGIGGNASAPTRQVNSLLAPGGYVGTWLRANGATDTLVALYRSAYTVEVPFGFVAQQTSGAAQREQLPVTTARVSLSASNDLGDPHRRMR